MENQHEKISGYRQLTQPEIDLMNRIKEKEKALLADLKELSDIRLSQQSNMSLCDLNMKQLGQSNRNIAIAKTNLQTGFMWAVRAVALPHED